MANDVDLRNYVSVKEHMEALRQTDQRALELLAKSSADRIKTGVLIVSLLISLMSVVVAVAAIALSRH